MESLIQYAMRFVGTPYKWGGSHPLEGFDCSGLLQVLLKAAGEDPAGDQTAQALYYHFIKPENGKICEPKPGAISFYGKDIKSIIHVAFCINEHQCIEAGGGGSQTTTLSQAVKDGAFVRMRLAKERKDYLCSIQPHYKKIGGGV